MENKETLPCPIESDSSLTPEAFPLNKASSEVAKEEDLIERKPFPIPKSEPELKERRKIDELDAYLEQLESGGILKQMAGMVVFGSVVRGDVSPRSDFDTLIVIKDLPHPVVNKTEKEIDRIQRVCSSFPTAKSKTERLIEWLVPRVGFYPQLRSVIRKTDFLEGKYQMLKTGDPLTKRLFPTKLTFASIVSQPAVLGDLEIPKVKMSRKDLIRELIKSVSVYGSLSLAAFALSRLSSWGNIGAYEFSKLSLKNCFFALRGKNGTFAEIEKEFEQILPAQFWEEFTKTRNSNWEKAGGSRLVSFAPKAVIKIHQHAILTIFRR